ncbi:hypothetical protein CJ232_02600 [Hoylesella timonensis]|uniref:Uncharacterized protein n=1 Tax=Hoylesella timonensis TaxID=386414 RepID=A0A2N6Q7N2_9BACT|nr:hypothetical protein CJ232_02600 [Hoylesella timonensis]
MRRLVQTGLPFDQTGRQVTLFRIQTLTYMALSFTANELNNKRKVGHACNSPFNSEKVTRKFLYLV